jgi:SAM-dependent methyltransferase
LLDPMQRTVRPEVMDDPALDAQRHHQALRGLARINRLSSSLRIVWAPIQELARTQRAATLRVLDVATGAGDLPIALWRRAQRSGLRLEVAAGDISQRAIAHARDAAARQAADVQFIELDALNGELPCGYDVVISSLFLHHLASEQAADLLRRMAGAAGQMLLLNDLRRCRRGALLAWAVPRLICRSDVVHADALASVRAAFTLDEARHLALRAGLDGATVERRWPCRFLLSWRR